MSSTPASSASWPRDSITVKPDGTVAVDWNNAQLTNKVLDNFVSERLPVLLGMLPSSKDGTATRCSVNISGNRLTAPGPMAHLLEKLREAGVHVTELRLQQNEFSDNVVDCLCDHIRTAGAAGLPLASLQAGSNRLTVQGVRALVEAVSQSGGYPSSRVQHCRIWVEHQNPALTCPPDLYAYSPLSVDANSVCILMGIDGKPPNGKGKERSKGVEAHNSGASAVDGKPPDNGKSKGRGKGVKAHSSGASAVDGKPPDNGKSKGRGKGVEAHSSGASGVATASSNRDSKHSGGGKGAAAKNGGKGFKGWRDLPDHDDVLSWLKQKRESSREFEATWKAWCAENQLTGLPKATRLQKMLEFKTNWEAGSLELTQRIDVDGAGQSDQSEIQNASTVSAPSISSTPAPSPPPSTPSPTTQTEKTKEVVADTVHAESQPIGSSLQSKAAAAVKIKLQRAIDVGAVKDSCVPDREPGSEWQRFAHLGNQAIEQGCSQRSFKLGGSFLDEDGLSELSGACVSKCNLSVVYDALGLAEHIKDGNVQGNERQKAGNLAAIVGELDSASQASRGLEFETVRFAAAKSIMDFVFLFGYTSITSMVSTGPHQLAPIPLDDTCKASCGNPWAVPVEVTPSLHIDSSQPACSSTTPAPSASENVELSPATPSLGIDSSQPACLSTKPAPSASENVELPAVTPSLGIDSSQPACSSTKPAPSASENVEQGGGRLFQKEQICKLLSLGEGIPDECVDFPIGTCVITIRRDKFLMNSKLTQLLQLANFDSSQKKAASGEHFVVIGSCLWKVEDDDDDTKIAIIAVRNKSGKEGLLDAESFQQISEEEHGKSQIEALREFMDQSIEGYETDAAVARLLQPDPAELAAVVPSFGQTVSDETIDGLQPQETEEAARARRLEAQRQRRGETKWNYSGESGRDRQAHGEELQPKESNQAAMRRLLGGRLENGRSEAAAWINNF